MHDHLFPLGLFFLLRRSTLARTAAVLACACAVVLAWRFLLVLAAGAGHDYTYYATDTRFDSLLERHMGTLRRRPRQGH
jgi:peptidoglycan/LPS O-acetylase OafA/YrhL